MSEKNSDDAKCFRLNHLELFNRFLSIAELRKCISFFGILCMESNKKLQVLLRLHPLSVRQSHPQLCFSPFWTDMLLL